MAYGTKYKFRFNSVHGVQYTVNLLQNGYSGDYTLRPLGKAPVIRMKDGDPFLATSCDLVLECQVDGEFASLYTSDPFEYRIDVYRGGEMDIGGTQIWTGFIATELYSEPNIAPPYDVAVTATDGLGILKEYKFEASGLKPLGDHMRALLQQTGLNLAIDWTMKLHAASGTVPNFVDVVSINMDYMVGETYYDVLKTLLESLHCTITQYNGHWFVNRETDLTISSGNIPIYRTPTRTGSTTSTSISGARCTVGKMGVADMWPVGYTTRRAVPAKQRIAVEAPWHIGNVAESVQDNDWTIQSGYYATNASFVSVGGGNSYYLLEPYIMYGTPAEYGKIYMDRSLECFTKSISVNVRAAGSRIGLIARFTPTGGSTYYWNGGDWGTTEPTSPNRTQYQQLDINTLRADEAAVITFDIPAHGDSTTGSLRITLTGDCKVFDVDIHPVINKGYRDDIVIDNGARGDGDTVSITGGRMTSGEFDLPQAYLGIWKVGNGVNDAPVYTFTDNNFASKDFMSIQALGRAMSIALPRIETSGVIDFPTGQTLPPLVIYANSTNSIVKTYDWDLYNENLTFTAISFPAASLTVTSETVTSLGSAESGSSYGAGGSSSGGGGYILPVASATSLGGVKVGTGLSIDDAGVLSSSGGGSTVSISDVATSGGVIAKLTINGTTTSIKNRVEWGSSGSNKAELYVNNSMKTVLLDGWSELPSVSSSDNGKVLKVVSGHWTKGTISTGGSINETCAPKVMLRRQAQVQGNHPWYFDVSHPVLQNVSSAEAVLMVYSRKRSRYSQGGTDKTRGSNSRGWAAALGKDGGAAFTMTGRNDIDLKTYLIQNYMCAVGQARLDTMTLSQFESGASTAYRAFGHVSYSNGATFRSKTRRSRVFGIAVRYENPDFTAAVSGTLSDHTTMVNVNGAAIPRWIYTDVAKVRVVCQYNSDTTKWELGFNIIE